jgi:hypothetical protein
VTNKGERASAQTNGVGVGPRYCVVDVAGDVAIVRHKDRKRDLPANQERDAGLADIEDEREEGEILAAGAQNVGRADIARADLPDVAEPRELRDHQPERDRAQQVADDGRRREKQG